MFIIKFNTKISKKCFFLFEYKNTKIKTIFSFAFKLYSNLVFNLYLFLFYRSKSRSVDHGLAAPFDLDSLRSKVEGRFESVDRLSSEYESRINFEK